MNIFFTSINPETAAENLNHPRLTKKMWIEDLQMLCTTYNLKGIQTPGANFNPAHESRMWLDESIDNVRWLIDHTAATIMLAEPMLKNPPKFKGQLAIEVLDFLDANISRLGLPLKGLTLPYLAMKKHSPDLVKAHAKLLQLKSPVSGKFNTAWRADSWLDATTAYQAFLRRKDYWKPEYTFA